GGRKRLAGDKARASPAMSGAAAAISATAISSPAPITIVGLRRAKVRNAPPRRGAVGCASAIAAISVPDPRLEQRVGEVDQQIDQNIDTGEHHDDALDDRVIAP